MMLIVFDANFVLVCAVYQVLLFVVMMWPRRLQLTGASHKKG